MLEDRGPDSVSYSQASAAATTLPPVFCVTGVCVRPVPPPEEHFRIRILRRDGSMTFFEGQHVGTIALLGILAG